MWAELYRTLDKWAEQFVINCGLHCDFQIADWGNNKYALGFFFGTDCCYKEYVLRQVGNHHGLLKLNWLLRRKYYQNRYVIFQTNDSSDKEWEP